MSAEDDALTAVLREHRADGWVCTCGWPLTDSVGSVVDHLAEQIRPLMRCPVADPTGLPCRLFPGHAGEHGDGRGVVWTRPIPPGADLIGTCPDGSRCQAPRECVAARSCTRPIPPDETERNRHLGGGSNE